MILNLCPKTMPLFLKTTGKITTKREESKEQVETFIRHKEAKFLIQIANPLIWKKSYHT